MHLVVEAILDLGDLEINLPPECDNHSSGLVPRSPLLARDSADVGDEVLENAVVVRLFADAGVGNGEGRVDEVGDEGL